MYHLNIGVLKRRVIKRGLCTLRTPPPTPHKKKISVVEAPNSDQDPHWQFVGYRIVNQVEIESRSSWTNSAMTHVPLLSVEVRRNEWLR